jgi:hypothetical protein
MAAVGATATEAIAENPGPLPPGDYASGPVLRGTVMYDPPCDWSTIPRGSVATWPVQRPDPSTGLLTFIRRNLWNMAGIAGFQSLRQGAGQIDWTNNDTGQSDDPLSPLPFDRLRVERTEREVFDTRLHADYWPREVHQLGAVPRKYVGQAGISMLPPYFPLLTEVPPTTSYGSTTQVLAGAVSSGESPYASR